jgi:hypothetical protein
MTLGFKSYSWSSLTTLCYKSYGKCSVFFKVNINSATLCTKGYGSLVENREYLREFENKLKKE